MHRSRDAFDMAAASVTGPSITAILRLSQPKHCRDRGAGHLHTTGHHDCHDACLRCFVLLPSQGRTRRRV